MSAHRAHTTLRRSFTAAVLAIASGAGFLAAAGPATAAGPWYVATNGTNNATCGATPATPCQTTAFLIAQARFVDGDTINVAAGTYTDRPGFAGKTATVNGAGTATTIFTGGGTAWAMTSNVAAAKTLRLNDLTLTNGKGTNGLGGAFAAGSGQIVMTNVNLTGSTSTNVGGGAYVPAAAAGSLTMNGGTVSGNTATNGGGGIYTAGGTVTLNGTTITNNTVTGLGGGGFYAAAGTHTLSNTTISQNKALAGVGGGIASAATVNLASGSVTGNTAVNGAGVYNNTGTFTASATSITANTATNQGAGYFQQAGTATLGQATVNGNTAVAGAVTVIGGTLGVTDGSISGNTAVNGGALLNLGTTTLDGTVLDGNAALGGTTANGGNGGAIYNAGALTVKNASLTGNKVTANTNAAPGFTGYGGAVFSGSLTSTGAPTLSFQNTAINGGGVSGGNANAGGAIAALGNLGAGGANTTITATGLTLSKNVALAAGGIYTLGSTTLTDSSVDQNKATHASAGLGGGIYVLQSGAAPTLTLDGTDVTTNDGVAGGGGIVAGAGVTTVVKGGSTVSGNTGALGAGIFTAGPLSVTGSHVDGNSASNTGGGIYTTAAATVSGSSIDDNSAAFLGGGFTTGTTGSLAMTGGTLSGNDAFGGGGAFIANNLVASFDGTDLIGNTSTGQNFGGGAVLSAGQVSINKATISGNKADGASGLGGAVFSGSDDANTTTSLKITDSLLTGNEAFNGSVVYAASDKASSTNKTSISGSTVTGNASQSAAGAIVTYNPMSITGSTITGNTATGGANAYGGIVAAADNLVSLSGSILTGNSGHQCITKVNDGGYNLQSPADAGCGLSAAKNDVFTAPQLGALANNGGPTKTLLPGPTSPALDRIPAGTGTGTSDAISGAGITLCGAGATDQRGTSRPQGAKCDIGAVEADQVVPTVDGPGAFTYSVGIAGAVQVYTSTGSPQPTLSATGLPAGVTFTDNGDGTGAISGTPAAGTGGVYNVTVKATNEAGSGTTSVTLTVNQAPALAGPASATYTVGEPGGPNLFTATGNPVPSLSSSGTLPGGVGFADNGDGTGAYSGTPTAGSGGAYDLTVKASNGTPPDATKAFALTVNEAAALTGPSSATFKVGTAGASGAFHGTGFPVPTLSATGLPAGLSLAGTGTGTISGTPANGTGGVHPVTVTATNGVGSPASRNVSVTVNEAPELTGPTEARFVTGSAGAIGFSSDGFPQATLTRTGALPAGLTFTDNGNGSATISGTAPASAVGTYPVTVTASNGQSPDASITVTIEVVPPLSVATTSLPHASFHSGYSTQLMASGGQPGYTWQVVNGQLPQGLTMNSFGQISGSPTVSAGIYIFTVKVTDAADPAQTATRVLSIQVTKGTTTIVPTAILLGLLPNGDITLNVGLVEADLTGGFPAQPIAGATVTFKSGNATVCSGKTDAKGHAQCSQNLLNALLTPLKGTLTATFAGDLNWLGSSGTASLIQKS